MPRGRSDALSRTGFLPAARLGAGPGLPERADAHHRSIPGRRVHRHGGANPGGEIEESKFEVNLVRKDKTMVFGKLSSKLLKKSDHSDSEILGILTDITEIKTAYNNIALLSEIGKEITGNLSVEKIIEIVYKQVNNLMDATVFALGNYNPATKRLEFNGAIENGEKSDFYFYELADQNRTAVICFETQSEIFTNDFETEHRKFIRHRLPPKTGNRVESLIYLPLMGKNKIRGVITVQSYNKNSYSENHLNLFRNIAVYTAIALENAGIYNDLENQKNEIIEKNTILEHQQCEIKNQAEILKTANRKLIEMDEFKQGVSRMIVHDLKNPLAVILSIAENPEIKNAGNQMLNLVMNILEVQKFENAQMHLNLQNSDFQILAQNVYTDFQLLFYKKSINFKNEIKKQTILNVDIELIERVLINLLTNATKFTPANGEIKITGKEEMLGKNNFFKVEVSDTGIGIPPEFLDKIFDKFIQAEGKKSENVRSTGLGLTFCKLAVEAHGGKIGVKSELGKGTTIYFYLPLIEICESKIIPGIVENTEKNKFSFTKEEIEKLKIMITTDNFIQLVKLN